MGPHTERLQQLSREAKPWSGENRSRLHPSWLRAELGLELRAPPWAFSFLYSKCQDLAHISSISPTGFHFSLSPHFSLMMI